jgi:hypothetical protein
MATLGAGDGLGRLPTWLSEAWVIARQFTDAAHRFGLFAPLTLSQTSGPKRWRGPRVGITAWPSWRST